MSREFDSKEIGRNPGESISDYLIRLHERRSVCMVASYKKTSHQATLILDMGSQDDSLDYKDKLRPLVVVNSPIIYNVGDILLVHQSENAPIQIVGPLFSHNQIKEISTKGVIWPFRDWQLARNSLDSSS